MTEPNLQSQILLQPEQYKTLEQMASSQGCTISEIAQQVVDLGLKFLEEQRKVQDMEILERLNQRRLEYFQKHGVYQGDLLAEVRAEREKQIDRVMRGEW